MTRQTLVTITLAAVILGALAVVVSYVLGWASRVFHVDVDPRLEAITDALPGANCGACGFRGCAEYAEAVLRGEVAVDRCVPGGVQCVRRLAAIMGVEPAEHCPRRAVVHCRARDDQRPRRVTYRGESTCAAAHLVAHTRPCAYGCLGLGDCVRVCKYNAIRIDRGLATVDYRRCVGCGACVDACPRKLISVIPFPHDPMPVIACANRDAGPDVKGVCECGCLGCGRCTRANDVIKMDGYLPTINYDAYNPEMDFEGIAQACPTGSLLLVGTTIQIRG